MRASLVTVLRFHGEYEKWAFWPAFLLCLFLPNAAWLASAGGGISPAEHCIMMELHGRTVKSACGGDRAGQHLLGTCWQ
jgi:hypothetical protein